MKKVVFGLLTVAFLITASCSEDAKINRKLEGDWKVFSYDSDTLGKEENIVYSFERTEKLSGQGNLSSHETFDGINTNQSIPFTYVIANQKITLAPDSGSDPKVYTIVNYKKNNLVFRDIEGKITVLQPE